MILGIDLGSSRLKLTLLSLEGNVLASEARYYSESSSSLLAAPLEWTEESVLEVLSRQVAKLAGSAGKAAQDVQAICVSATAPDFWVLPHPLAKPIGPWCGGFSARPVFNERDLAEAAKLADTDDPWKIEFCIRSVAARRTLEALPEGATYQTRHGWLYTLLTGAHELDSATACELGAAYDPGSGAWATTIIEQSLGRINMPEVHTAGRSVHRVIPQAAAKLGLSADAIAVLGTCDSLCSMIAAGCLEPGDAFVYYGTYFCAAETNIAAYLRGDCPIPFNWRLSLPFAGRTLERLTCELYGREVGASFTALEAELDQASDSSVNAVLQERDRKPFIWEEATFRFSGIGPDFRRSDLPYALLREFGSNLARAFTPAPTAAWAVGGGARSRQIVRTVGSAARIDQRIISDHTDAFGTALLALRAIKPDAADAMLRTRRSSAALHPWSR